MSETNLACFPEEALRICKLSGAEAELKRSRLLTLEQCEDMLEQCIREARAARKSYNIFRAAELAARVVLVACDVVIMTLEEKTGLAGIAVGRTYSGSKLVIDAFSGNISKEKGLVILAENKAAIGSLAAEAGGGGGQVRRAARSAPQRTWSP